MSKKDMLDQVARQCVAAWIGHQAFDWALGWLDAMQHSQMSQDVREGLVQDVKDAQSAMFSAQNKQAQADFVLWLKDDHHA